MIDGGYKRGAVFGFEESGAGYEGVGAGGAAERARG
tara:strand:+ start:599 stop:706 length:108 start_codon:yes stop_codon:yes gene_type:complete